MFKKYKVLFICLFVFLFLLLCFLGYYFFYNRFIYSALNDALIVDVNSEFSCPNITACYGNKLKCSKVKIDVIDDVNTSLIGEYKIIYNISYKKHKKSISRDVKVVDKVSPEIITDVTELSVCPNASEFDLEYKALDNYDGDLSEKVVKEVVDNSLVLSVQDSSLNSSSKSILLKREDLEGPSITLHGNSTMYVALNSSFSDPGYEAYDKCDGNVTDKVSVSGSVDTSRAGTYKITYSATDSLGNSSTVSRSVSVYAPNLSGSKVVYLTFDDGPSQYTGELLNILAKYNVKATFFVTNVRSNYAYYIKQAHDQGHTIALHTNSHNYGTVYASVDAYFNDLNLINETVKRQTGSYSNLLRFPGGSSNTVSRKYSSGIMSTLSRMVTEKGYKYFDWNVSSGDADGRTHSSSEYANNIIRGLGNGSYYIVLQHDTNINSIRAVSTVIEYGLSHGYTFKALSYDSPTVHHKIAN